MKMSRIVSVICSLVVTAALTAQNQEVKAEITGNRSHDFYTVVITDTLGNEISRSTFKKNTSTGFTSKLYFNFDHVPTNIISVYKHKPGKSTDEKIADTKVIKEQFVPKFFKIHLKSKPVTIELVGA